MIHSESLNQMGELFTRMLFTEEVVARQAVALPPTPKVRPSSATHSLTINNYLVIGQWHFNSCNLCVSFAEEQDIHKASRRCERVDIQPAITSWRTPSPTDPCPPRRMGEKVQYPFSFLLSLKLNFYLSIFAVFWHPQPHFAWRGYQLVKYCKYSSEKNNRSNNSDRTRKAKRRWISKSFPLQKVTITSLFLEWPSFVIIILTIFEGNKHKLHVSSLRSLPAVEDLSSNRRASQTLALYYVLFYNAEMLHQSIEERNKGRTTTPTPSAKSSQSTKGKYS